MKKNILFVVDERRMGGVSILLEDMMNMIDTSKYNIDILVLANHGEMLSNIKNANIIYGTKYFSSIDYTLKEVLKSKNIKKIYYKLKVIFDMKFNLIEKRIIKERKKILDKKYDVEIAFKDGFTALFTGFGDSKRKIHWLHYEYVVTNPCGNYPNLFEKVFKKFDQIIAVSKGVMDAFNNLYHLENKTSVIHNLVNIKKIKDKSLEESNEKLDKNKINIVCVGRLHPQKGYTRLMEVIAKLKKDNIINNNVCLRLYGTGPDEEEIKSLVDTHVLSDIVSLEGQVMNPYKYIKNNDLFILSSVYEPFGLVIVESMTVGVPVLACSCAATSLLIKNKYNGYITENSKDGLYQGLAYLIKNKEELKKYKNNLKDYQYDNTKIIKQLEGVLDDKKKNK